MPIFSPLNLASGLARAGLVRSRPNFELAYSQIEQTVVNRINKGIDEVVEDAGRDNRVLAELDSKSNKLRNELPFLDRYKFDVEANALKLEGISEKLTDLADLFALDDDDSNLTTNEVEKIKAARDDILNDMKRLYIVHYPGVPDTKDIYFLRKAAEELEAFEPTAGAVDAEGTTNPNVNREMLDLISVVQNKAVTAQTVASEAMYLTLGYQLNAQKKLAEIESERIDITVVGAQKRSDEIDDLKSGYSNLLKAISLSFEVSFSQMESLGNSLDLDRRPPPGSVLNIIS